MNKRRPAKGAVQSRGTHSRSNPNSNSNSHSNPNGTRRNKFDSSKNLPQRSSGLDGVFIVEGIAAIQEYLSHRPDSVKAIYVKERSEKTIRQALARFKISAQIVKDSADQSIPQSPVWAHVKHDTQDWSVFLSRVKAFSENQKDIVLVLDHISDPRNLGAIVRSAAFFGVRHVIVPERRQVLLSQSAVNTAQGGFALTDLIVVVNVARAIEELKEHQYWVLGADMDGEPCQSIGGRYERQAIVLGSEDAGISQNVRSHCDLAVSIASPAKSLESLNVSVAAGILLHTLSRD